MSTFIVAEKAVHSESVICRALGVARSGVCRKRTQPPSKRSVSNAALLPKIRRISATHRERYGSPRIHRELVAQGERTSENRVARIMRQAGISARRKRRFVQTTDSKHGLPVAPNLLARRFSTTSPNQAWVGDVTYLHTAEGWLYLSVLIDLFSRRVVGWSAKATMSTDLTLAALRRALAARSPSAVVHHTDRGSNYCAGDYQAELRRASAVTSMSRVADCWDNAVAESFFATLKRELGESFDSRSGAIQELNSYIDYYNFERRHSHNNYESPVNFELARQKSLAA